MARIEEDWYLFTQAEAKKLARAIKKIETDPDRTWMDEEKLAEMLNQLDDLIDDLATWEG